MFIQSLFTAAATLALSKVARQKINKSGQSWNTTAERDSAWHSKVVWTCFGEIKKNKKRERKKRQLSSCVSITMAIHSKTPPHPGEMRISGSFFFFFFFSSLQKHLANYSVAPTWRGKLTACLEGSAMAKQGWIISGCALVCVTTGEQQLRGQLIEVFKCSAGINKPDSFTLF